MGGDEFAVLQVDPEGVSEARRLGERLIEALHRNADLAMYKAKSDGRNRCQVFDEALNHHARRLALVEQALREPGVDGPAADRLSAAGRRAIRTGHGR